MQTLSSKNTPLKNIFKKKRGSATGISLAFSAGILALSLATVAIVINTVKENKNVENSSIAYYAAERGAEYAMFSISGHLAGYELDKDSDLGKLISKNNNAKTIIEINSQSISGADELKTITVPQKGSGNSESDDGFNRLSQGETRSIPLFIDNTTKEEL